MVAITSTCTIRPASPVQAIPVEGWRSFSIITAACDTGDTIAITLEDYKIRTFMGAIGWVHTTLNSVSVQEQPTTAVSAGVLTLTVGGSTVTNKRRAYLVTGYTRAI